jgi:hypothetical protein
MGTENFVVRPASAGGWDYIAAALARLFGRLRMTGRRHCVIVEVPDDRYVQFMVHPEGRLWAESVGDVFLDGDSFDDDQRRTLELLRWNAPEPGGRGKGNYWREFEAPAEDLEAATIAVLTCVDVFGAGPRDQVHVKVFEAAGARE